jgi:DNA repair photolyase
MKEEYGVGDGGLNKLLEDMEKTEEEIVNKMISDETLRRQKDILTRLLQHERAEKRREKEARRKSTEAKNKKNSNPPDLMEYKSLQSKEAELLRTVPPKLKPYYKEKVTEYLYQFLVL